MRRLAARMLAKAAPDAVCIDSADAGSHVHSDEDTSHRHRRVHGATTDASSAHGQQHSTACQPGQ